MISFVTVVYNDCAGLEKTIASLERLSLIGVKFEHIIIDGMSLDGTKELIEAKDFFYPVQVVSERDNGIYDAMNKGIDLCSGRYINFLNAGDRLDFEIFDWAEFSLSLDDENAELIACGYFFGNIKNQFSRRYPRLISLFLPGMPSSHQALFFQRKSLRNVRYSEKFSICGDYDFVMNLMSTGARLKLCNDPCVTFYSGGVSFKHPRTLLFESMKVSSRYCKNKLILPFKLIQLVLSLLILHVTSRI